MGRNSYNWGKPLRSFGGACAGVLLVVAFKKAPDLEFTFPLIASAGMWVLCETAWDELDRSRRRPMVRAAVAGAGLAFGGQILALLLLGGVRAFLLHPTGWAFVALVSAVFAFMFFTTAAVVFLWRDRHGPREEGAGSGMEGIQGVTECGSEGAGE